MQMRYSFTRATNRSFTYFYRIEKYKKYLLNKVIIKANPMGRYRLSLGTNNFIDVSHNKGDDPIIELNLSKTIIGDRMEKFIKIKCIRKNDFFKVHDVILDIEEVLN